MDAILLTTQVDIEYYTGFKSQFFQSPTRPWYVLIPSHWKAKSNYSHNWRVWDEGRLGSMIFRLGCLQTR